MGMSQNQEIVKSIKNYIDSKIECNVSPDDASKVLNYSLKQLNRIFFMSTGITVSEYIRWNKLVKSLFELKYTDNSIIDIAIKYGYESQESYTRAFKDNFALNPGEYRKTKQQIIAKNWHINEFIHQEAHNAFDEGLRVRGNVENWIIVKPERIWVSARRNTGKLQPGKFYNLPGDELLKRVFTLPDIISGGGAYFPSDDYSGLSFGVEVAEDYPLELLKGFEIIRVPQSKYVVFNYPRYPIENHGDAIYSTWHAQKDYDITALGLKWNLKKMPIFEDDDNEVGYTLFFPVTENLSENIK